MTDFEPRSGSRTHTDPQKRRVRGRSEPMAQLTLDGEERNPPRVSRSAPLNPTQHAILRHAREHGSIRSGEAGRYVHAARDGGTCKREQRLGPNGRGSCCRYASTDGLAACKRLAARGLLEHADERGVWRVPEAA